MVPFEIQRLCVIMEPRDGDPLEREGVCNPAAARGRDGALYLFPRVVAANNFSRIGVARVCFDASGDLAASSALAMPSSPPPTTNSTRPPDGGGCEDPRITFVGELDEYVMAYTALSPRGPRIALAKSDDLMTWERIGLAKFHRVGNLDFDEVDDKDASIFPTLVNDPENKVSIALLHRPLFHGTRPEEMMDSSAPEDTHKDLQTIWVSYWHCHEGTHVPSSRQFVALRRLAMPEAPWERLKIGGGAPPIECRHGWLFLYHGVHEVDGSTPEHPKFCYSAGVMILDRDHPHRILYRRPSRC